eukprot:TRINITY_DN22957_c0_g4_i1.p1 TRINITY_DN22957_c0_g4~~TRINITY_DN22957_c0_g4_i1.p1  ORF type:complete len:413 (-),score=35.68 TRINITY_DN22957_c0_g4_i1:59-1297(-)
MHRVVFHVVWWLSWLNATGLALNVRPKPFNVVVQAGRKFLLVWNGPGRVDFNASCVGNASLNFYVVSGNKFKLSHLGKRILDLETPACSACHRFHGTYELPSDNKNVTLLIASNNGTSSVRLRLNEELLNVPSCLERCSAHPLQFIAAFVIALILPVLCLSFTRRFARDANGDRRNSHLPWDEAWVPMLMSCTIPPKPTEAWRRWILHGWRLSYPWNPWRNDPLEFWSRCLVLAVSLGLTLFVSTLYGEILQEWDLDVKWLPTGNEPIDVQGGASPGMLPTLAVSSLSMLLQSGLRTGALAIFNCSLTVSHLQPRRRVKTSALILAASVVAVCIFYPVYMIASKHLCLYLKHLAFQFLMAEALRGVPMALGLASLEHYALRRWGKEVICDRESSLQQLGVAHDAQLQSMMFS